MGTPSLMTAAVMAEPHRVRLAAVPTPRPGAGEALVRVRAVGVCGTDVQVYRGELSAAVPMVLGHEYAGEVAEVGPGVTPHAVGDRVAGAGGWACGTCEGCRRSAPCQDRRSLGRNVQGAFAEYVLVPAATLYRLPPGVTFVAGQATVTLATAYRALARLGDVGGREIALIGPGHAGLILLQVLRAAGAAGVTVIGTRPARLERARALGASATVRAAPAGGDGTDAPDGAFDVVVEAAGTPSAVRLAVRLARPGGTVVVYGITKAPVDGFPADQLYHKELHLLGSRGATGGYPRALEALESGGIQVEPLVTHRLPLADAPLAMALAVDRKDEVLRIVLEP